MSDIELRSLTPKMRALIGEISDADVASYPAVLAGQSSRQSVASNEGEENYPDAIAAMRDKRPGSR